MVYRVVLITCLLWASGCQTKAPPPPRQSALDADTEYEAVAASALVFDPPVVQDEPRLELSRADRQPGVVVGYEELIAESFFIRMDDRQTSDGGFGFRGGRFGGGSRDRYERRAVTERVGVRYR